MRVFHEGELAVQAQAGVADAAARLGPRMIGDRLDADLAGFLAERTFLVVAAADAGGAVWTSIVSGPPGFARAADARHVSVAAPVAEPLAGMLAADAALGLLAIDPATRGRIRLNGIGRRTPDGFALELREAFGNCPKYIARRVPATPTGAVEPGAARRSTQLDADQRALVSSADTLFVGSRHPERGADASHRGGRPGFVAVAPDGSRLSFPDYAGNNMFQTLGNLTADPAVGLLFTDWETGRTLQVSGRATVGADRRVDVAVDAVLDRPHGAGGGWTLVEPHRLNPPV